MGQQSIGVLIVSIPTDFSTVPTVDTNQKKAALKSRSNARKKGTATTLDTTTPEASQQGLDKLTISQRLKEVLCSKLMFSDANADEYCKDVCQSKY